MIYDSDRARILKIGKTFTKVTVQMKGARLF